MKPELQRVYEDIPADPPRSRLEPYRELILRWRRQRRTYRRIRTLLADQFSISVSTTTLFKFVKGRSRPRKAEPELAADEIKAVIAPFAVQPPVPIPQTAGLPGHSKTSDDPYAEVRERMRKHKAEPTLSKPAKIFEIPDDEGDEIKPLRMLPTQPAKEK